MTRLTWKLRSVLLCFLILPTGDHVKFIKAKQISCESCIAIRSFVQLFQLGPTNLTYWIFVVCWNMTNWSNLPRAIIRKGKWLWCYRTNDMLFSKFSTSGWILEEYWNNISKKIRTCSSFNSLREIIDLLKIFWGKKNKRNGASFALV